MISRTKIYGTQYVTAIVVGILVISFLREPLFFLEPRIWAEEGTIHIKSVFNHGIWASFLQPHLGCYSFFNNFVVVLGLALLGLDKVAYVTTTLSFVVSAATILTPLVLPSKYWESNSKKLLVLSFALLIGPAKIWVNTINAQFYFGLFTCFLLLSDTEKVHGWRRCYALVMLVQGVLTGITSVILLPFFVWKYLLRKNTTRFENTILIVLCVGSAVQLTALFYLAGNAELGRFSVRNFQNFPYGLARNLTGFVPVADGERLIRLAFLAAVTAVVFHQRKRLEGYPLMIALYISAVFAVLSIGMHGGGRYGYIPSVLIFILLLNVRPAPNSLGIFNAAMIGALLCLSFFRFFNTSMFYDSSWVPYSLENAYKNPAGDLEVKIFPQWKDANWVLTLPSGKYERYK